MLNNVFIFSDVRRIIICYNTFPEQYSSNTYNIYSSPAIINMQTYNIIKDNIFIDSVFPRSQLGVYDITRVIHVTSYALLFFFFFFVIRKIQ